MNPLSLFPVCLTIYNWAHRLPLRVVCFPGESPLEDTKFSFVSGYVLEISSGLGMVACIQFSFQH